MQKYIFSRSFAVLKKKPFALWGISLLNILFTALAYFLGGSVPLIGLAVGLLLQTSMTMIYLHGLRGEGVKVVHLFDCFKDWATVKRVLCGMGWMFLWIFLWALIPFAGVVFAIIRAYEYRLVPYILVTEPDIAPTEAIKVSRERTAGYKGKMFWSDVLVYLIPSAVLLTLDLLALIPFVGPVLFGVPAAVIGLFVSVVQPLLLGLIQAAYYEEISHPTISLEPKPKAVPAPVAPAAPVGGGFCPNCGAPQAVGGVFCPNCGTRLQ